MDTRNFLATLAREARADGPSAAKRVRGRMERDMTLIVRGTLQQGVEKTPLDRRIFAAARALGLDECGDSPEDREDVVQAVARQLRDRVLRNLASAGDVQQGHRAETVRDRADFSLQSIG